MARRQDSGSNSAHQNERPTSHSEDALPDTTEGTRGRGDEADEDEFEEANEEDDDEVDEDEEEGIS